MNLKWRTSVVRMIVCFAVIVAMGGFAMLEAQSKAPGKVTGSPFDAIQATLDQILAALAPTSPGPVRLTTTAVRVSSSNQVVWCMLTNVGTAPLGPMTRRLVGIDGTVVGTGSNPEVLPGNTVGAGYFYDAGFFRCEFTFVGTAATVRASLLLEGPDGALVSVDAR